MVVQSEQGALAIGRFSGQGRWVATWRFCTRNAQRSAASSMILLVGLPAPCPAFVSVRVNQGGRPPCAACSAAADLHEWPGAKRSSWAAGGAGGARKAG